MCECRLRCECVAPSALALWSVSALLGAEITGWRRLVSVHGSSYHFQGLALKNVICGS